MTDLSQTIAPKSDQLNADDLIGQPKTIKVSRVSRMSEPDQPIAINFEGDGGKPYKPCKSMRRVLVTVWGSDGAAYAGRRMTLYRDDKVQFGGMAVGGIRISHMSGIDRDVTLALTVTRASRKPYTIKPLRGDQDPGTGRKPTASADRTPDESAPKPQTGRERLMTAARERASEGTEALREFRATLTAQQDGALAPILADLERAAADAYARDDAPVDDDFPGFGPAAEEAA